MGISESRLIGLSQLAPTLLKHPGSGNRRQFTEADVRRLIIASKLVDMYMPMRIVPSVVEQFGDAVDGLWVITTEYRAFRLPDDPVVLWKKLPSPSWLMNLATVLRALAIWRGTT